MNIMKFDSKTMNAKSIFEDEVGNVELYCNVFTMYFKKEDIYITFTKKDLKKIINYEKIEPSKKSRTIDYSDLYELVSNRENNVIQIFFKRPVSSSNVNKWLKRKYDIKLEHIDWRDNRTVWVTVRKNFEGFGGTFKLDQHRSK